IICSFESIHCAWAETVNRPTAARPAADFQNVVIWLPPRLALIARRTAAEGVPLGGPLCGQILAHVERAGHSFAAHFSGEAIGQRGPVNFADAAGQPYIVS